MNNSVSLHRAVSLIHWHWPIGVLFSTICAVMGIVLASLCQHFEPAWLGNAVHLKWILPVCAAYYCAELLFQTWLAWLAQREGE